MKVVPATAAPVITSADHATFTIGSAGSFARASPASADVAKIVRGLQTTARDAVSASSDGLKVADEAATLDALQHCRFRVIRVLDALEEDGQRGTRSHEFEVLPGEGRAGKDFEKDVHSCARLF